MNWLNALPWLLLFLLGLLIFCCTINEALKRWEADIEKRREQLRERMERAAKGTPQ